MDAFELFRRSLKEVSDQKLNETICKGALKMSDEQIATVSFTFWLVYMAETDLNEVLQSAWSLVKLSSSPEVYEETKKMLTGMIGGEKTIDVDNLEYFSDKIKIEEALYGENDRTKLLWKLNDIRNDLSHNRIKELQYNGQPLFLRETKEKILKDYFETGLAIDLSKSRFWNSLSEEEKNKAKKMFEEAKNKGLI